MLNNSKCLILTIAIFLFAEPTRSVNTTRSYMEIGPRIISGKPTTIAKHPHLMRILADGFDQKDRSKRVTHLGHGALISEQWVLTAGHVVDRKKYDTITVAGAIQRKEDIIIPANFMQFREACSVIVNSRSARLNASDTRLWLNDVALVQLCEPMIPNQWIKPLGIDAIPKSSGNELFRHYRQCKIAGLGRIADNQYASVLQEAELELIAPTEKCRDLGYITDPVESVLCAFSPYQSAYYGDSGTPLMCNGKLLGVLTSGRYRCTASPCKRVGFYVRMDYWYQWVRDIVTGSHPT